MANLRDEHRLRERIDLSLDERQVAPLAIAALLLFGGVFAIGVYVGKGLASNAPAAQPAGDLDALDARRDESVAAAAKKPKPVEKVVANPAEPADQAASDEAKKQADAAAAAEKAKQEKAAADARAAQQKADKEKADQAAREKAAADKAAREKAEKAAREKADREKRDKAAAREKALAAAAAAAAGKSAPAAEPALAGGDFTVQIGSTKDRAEADQLVASAKDKGLSAFIAEADLGDKGTWYRVRVGSYADKAAAEKARKDVERELGGKPLVMQVQ